MRKLWRNQTVKHFVKLYLIVFLLMTITVSAILAVFIKRTYNDTLLIAEAQAREGMKRVEREIESMISTISYYYDRPGYRIIEAGDNHLKTEYTYELSEEISYFTATVNSMLLPEDLGLIMKGRMVLCKNQFHDSVAKYYGKFMSEEGYADYESWLKSLQGLSGMCSFRVSRVKNINREYDAVMMILPLSSGYKGNGTVFFAQLEKSRLISLLALESLTDDIALQLDTSGNTFALSGSGFETEKAQIAVEGKYGLTLFANVSKDNVFDTMKDMFGILGAVLSVYLVVGILLAVYFIRRSAVPLIRIMNSAEIPPEQNKTEMSVQHFRDGYDNLRQFIGSMSEKYHENQRLVLQQKEILAHSQLEHALCDPLGSGSYEGLLRYYPDFPMPWRMILFKISGQSALSVDDESMLISYMSEAFGEGGGDAVTHLFENILILFVPAQEGAEGAVERILEKLSKVLPKEAFIARQIAVSAAYASFDMMHTVFSRLRFILETGEENASAAYVESEPINEKEDFSAPDKQNWNRFSSLIMRNQLDDALALLMQDVRGAIFANATGSELMQLFYLYRNALLSVVSTLTVPCPVSIPQYSSSADIVSCFEELCDAARKVHEALREQMTVSREASSLEADIIRHLDENFLNADICVLSVTEAFSIPEAQLQRIIRMYTGKSFHAYIEGKRMEHAARLLTETDAPVSKVLQECGYFTTSTFYRAFKMYYGDTPSNYREKFLNNEKEPHGT